MTEKKISHQDLILFAAGIVLIVVTPFVARLIAPLFDWACYGALRQFFEEIFTAALWVVEIVLLAVFYYKKWDQRILSNPEVKGKELPVKRIVVISFVTALCILVISAQIRFQVKPFYDLGEKFNGYELLGHVGIYVKNIIKCVWIVILLKAGQHLIEQCFVKADYRIPYAGFLLVMTVGVYDMIVGANTLALTYLFLYAIYGWLYLLTDRSMSKTYLLVMFLYLF